MHKPQRIELISYVILFIFHIKMVKVKTEISQILKLSAAAIKDLFFFVKFKSKIPKMNQ